MKQPTLQEQKEARLTVYLAVLALTFFVAMWCTAVADTSGFIVATAGTLTLVSILLVALVAPSTA